MFFLAYPMRFEPAEEGGFNVQGLPPLEGVITFGETYDEAMEMASEALSGWLASLAAENTPVPRPGNLIGSNILLIQAEPEVAAPILLKWAREDAKLTQSQVAAKMGVKQQSYARLERPDANPSLSTLNKAFKAAGKRLTLAV